MRRSLLCLAVLMTLTCLLCACGGKDDPLQAPMDLRTRLLEAGGCAFALEGRAETDGGLWDLSLACDLDPDGLGAVTVTAPETIAGITARTEAAGNRLDYEDLSLALGTFPAGDLAPAAAPAALVRAWAQAWITSAGREGEQTLACYDAGDLEVRTWLDGDGLPLRAELYADGRLCFTAEIKEFEWK